MKCKGKIQTPSTTLLNESNIYSSYNSKDIPFNENKPIKIILSYKILQMKKELFG